MTSPRSRPPEQLAYFNYGHLPPRLQETSRPFAELAMKLTMLPGGEQKDWAFHYLLLAKDAAVRASLNAND